MTPSDLDAAAKAARDQNADAYFSRDKHPLDKPEPISSYYAGWSAGAAWVEGQNKSVLLAEVEQLQSIQRLFNVAKATTGIDPWQVAKEIEQADAYRTQCEKLAEALRDTVEALDDLNCPAGVWYCNQVLAEYEAFKKGLADE